MTDNATIKLGGKDHDYPVMSGSGRARRHRYPQALRPDRHVHLRSRLHLDRELRERADLYRRRRGRAAPPRLSDRPARRAIELHGGLLPAAQRRAADEGRARRLHLHDHAATRCCTSSSRPSIAASAATRTRWRSCAAWSARCRPSITIRPTSTIREQRMIASHRLIAKMPTIAAMAYKYTRRPAVPLSATTACQLHRQLPAHDVRRAGRAV